MKKRLVLLLFALLGCISSIAQNHISFLGIPIDGPVSTFANKLKEKGFTIEKTTDTGYTMSGTFTGKNVELYLFCTPKTRIASKVVIYYPERSSWYSIKSEYYTLKESFDKKYHVRNSFSFFSDPYYEGDGYEMQALRNGKCTYATFYDAEGGGIAIEISKFEQIKVCYEDDANMDKAIREREDAIMDEI